ncbi:MAG: hypothetical protein IMX00_04760 [Limnochordales bacterium]|nr:hypothetical protein [Limnochordales bacterium]
MSRQLVKLLLALVALLVAGLLYVPLLSLLLWVTEPAPWPGPFLAGLRQLFFLRPRLLLALANMLVVAIPAAAIALLLGLPAGWRLVQWERAAPARPPEAAATTRTRDLIVLLLLTRLLPAVAVGIPVLEISRTVRAHAPAAVLTLVYAAFGTPWAAGMGYLLFRRLPQGWEEAAWLLGLSPAQARRRVVWPLVWRDVLITGGLFLVGMANEVLLASLLLPLTPTVGAVVYRWWSEPGITAAPPALVALAALVLALPGWLLLLVAGHRLFGLWNEGGSRTRPRALGG